MLLPFNPSPGQAEADRSGRSRPSLRNKKYFFQDQVSLCSPGFHGTHSVHQSGLQLRDPHAFQVMGLKACTTMLSSEMFKRVYIAFSRGPELSS